MSSKCFLVLLTLLHHHLFIQSVIIALLIKQYSTQQTQYLSQGKKNIFFPSHEKEDRKNKEKKLNFYLRNV